MTKAVAIILCGTSPAIATLVKNGLLPEYEVIHVILTTAAGVAEIPLVLDGQTPPPSDPENIGTRNYSNSPKAVVLGGGYDDASIEAMQTASKAKRGIHWLRPNMDTPTPPLGPEYGKHMVKRVKTCLDELAQKGELDGEGTHFF